MNPHVDAILDRRSADTSRGNYRDWITEAEGSALKQRCSTATGPAGAEDAPLGSTSSQ